jgi:very-short-patch-repair endonuclease
MRSQSQAQSLRRSLLLAERASQMRACPTRSELVLWESIRARRLGSAFRRQVCVGRYIVDFLAPKERVVVEVDGGYHQRRLRADARRDEALRRGGYRVLRLEERLVMEQLPVALERIRAALLAARAAAQ